MSNFITTIEGDIVAVAQAAWAQTKTELESLEQVLLTEIKTDIQALLGKVEAGANIEAIETALLNIWSVEKPQIISALSSGAIQILIAAAKTAVALV